MVDLASLKKKQAKESNREPTPSANESPADKPNAGAGKGLSFLKAARSTESVPPAEKPAQPAKAAGGLSFLAKAGGTSAGKAGLGSGSAGNNDDSSAGTPGDNRDRADGDGGKRDGDSTSGKTSGAGGDALDRLAASTLGQDSIAPTKSAFADEVPADAPVRETDGLDGPAKTFCESLDSVYQAIHDPELLGGMIRNIMSELADHPEYRKLIQPKDVHTIVRAARESMGLARVKKEETKSKRGRKKTEVTDIDALKALEGMDFS